MRVTPQAGIAAVWVDGVVPAGTTTGTHAHAEDQPALRSGNGR